MTGLRNIDLCNDGKCNRVRMGKDRHEKDFTNKYLKKSKKISRNAGLVGALFMILMILILTTPNGLENKDRWIITIALLAALITFLVSMVNVTMRNTQIQTSSMFKVFELLASPEIRKSRKAIHDKYNEIKEGGKIFTGTEVEEDADIVLSSFDQVSATVLNKLLDKDLFFDTYGEMIVRDWKTFKDEIELRQKKNKKILRHFTSLKNEFEERLREDSAYKDSDTEPY